MSVDTILHSCKYGNVSVLQFTEPILGPRLEENSYTKRMFSVTVFRIE